LHAGNWAQPHKRSCCLDYRVGSGRAHAASTVTFVTLCRFLTRLHYCAVDPSHAGKAEQWGEHEVDHILFIRAAVDVASNPEEVADHRCRSLESLIAF